MAGEAEAAKEGIALVRELLPVVKELIGVAKGLDSTAPITTDTNSILLRIADTLDKILENTKK